MLKKTSIITNERSCFYNFIMMFFNHISPHTYIIIWPGHSMNAVSQPTIIYMKWLYAIYCPRLSSFSVMSYTQHLIAFRYDVSTRFGRETGRPSSNFFSVLAHTPTFFAILFRDRSSCSLIWRYLLPISLLLSSFAFCLKLMSSFNLIFFSSI